MNTSRIGLLGGTFDPVHTGHLQLAEAALRECCLDRVLFIPSASPPHKVGVPITSLAHRLAMLELVCRCNPRFTCSAIEGELPTPSYTIDTLRALGDQFPRETEFFFIIGVDAFLDFATWKSYRDILRLVNIVISFRNGHTPNQLTEFLQSIGYFWQNTRWRDEHGGGRAITILQTIPGQFSSTTIRRRIRGGIRPTGDTPDQVIDYIVKHQLYRTEPDARST